MIDRTKLSEALEAVYVNAWASQEQYGLTRCKECFEATGRPRPRFAWEASGD